MKDIVAKILERISITDKIHENAASKSSDLKDEHHSSQRLDKNTHSGSKSFSEFCKKTPNKSPYLVEPKYRELEIYISTLDFRIGSLPKTTQQRWCQNFIGKRRRWIQTLIRYDEADRRSRDLNAYNHTILRSIQDLKNDGFTESHWRMVEMRHELACSIKVGRDLWFRKTLEWHNLQIQEETYTKKPRGLSAHLNDECTNHVPKVLQAIFFRKEIMDILMNPRPLADPLLGQVESSQLLGS
ncbi:hypothetical protein GLAREA_09418 [Glarea lozoyensis ATCC 20868]|uniref:Uncharacterized protein n=1 Tax=Glarea lozoyensis (strain ATCC 20868 / MF5171) TaxID=1116229 RepID=S3DPE2_GLAL2|nr:uncharacterized protein GLAREA_09418 [Glarea lozoyensis ATCC 20868]EPE28298.1 hypothetical protein GLAREA_09418 [Glarea lozoyensis ATCC 20868]